MSDGKKRGWKFGLIVFLAVALGVLLITQLLQFLFGFQISPRLGAVIGVVTGLGSAAWLNRDVYLASANPNDPKLRAMHTAQLMSKSRPK